MKIERTDSPRSPAGPGNRKTPNPTGERFGDILEKTIASSSAAVPVAFLDRLARTGSIGGFIPAASRNELLGRADQLLQLLESCQSKIASRETSLRDACASVRAVEESANELVPYLDILPESDDFRAFLNRLVITASVEAIKFRRGDYL